jgi:hypothetical protein
VYSDVPVEEHPGLRSLVIGSRTAEGAEDEGINTFANRKLKCIWSDEYIRHQAGLLTRHDLAPSWLKHFLSHIAACRQSSLCDGLELTLGMEMNLESAYVRVSWIVNENRKHVGVKNKPDVCELSDGSTIRLLSARESASSGEVSSQT